MINQAEIKGESNTGYENGDKGPFECQNCKYIKDGYCTQSLMMKYSKLPKNSAGYVQVDPRGCCEYVDRKSELKNSLSKVSFASAVLNKDAQKSKK